jgi:prepilin-type N-terminal cleavage/methylation domain-containing protein
VPTLSRQLRRAFTLTEVAVCTVVLGVIATVLLPVINAAISNYAAANQLRDTADQIDFALARVLTALNEAPPGAALGTLDITSATASSIQFSNGRGFRLNGSTLEERVGSDFLPLARNVTAFSITYLAADGSTSTISTPNDTQRFIVSLRINATELNGIAFPRVRISG